MPDVPNESPRPKRPPNLHLLGATYGLLWTLVVLTTIAALQGDAKVLTDVAYFSEQLLACVLTAMPITWLFARWLPRFRTWTIVPFGLLGLALALMIWTFIALNLTCLAPDGTNADPQFRLSHWEWVSRNYEYMLRMMFGVTVMTVAPPILAVLNCWDLRRRMMKASTQP